MDLYKISVQIGIAYTCNLQNLRNFA
ncbi:MAG: hypothetical protein RI948_713, partial [Bacteroidota bacterium]